MAPETAFVVLLFVVVSVPVVVGTVALLNRTADDDEADELRRRVERLEAELDSERE